MKILLITLFILINIYASQRVTKIEFQGLTQISKKIALETLDIKKGGIYTSDQINKSLKRFWKFGYFKDISIYNKNGKLIIKFIEKPFIINISMTGYKTNEDDLKNIFSIMNIKKGNMFTKQRIKNAKEILLNVLKDEGYAHSVVEVDIKRVNPQSIAVVFNVNKGDEIIIKKVNYIGANKLSSSDLEENTANNEEDLISWWFGQNDGVVQFSQLQYDSLRIKDTYYKNGFLDAKVSSAYSLIDFNTNKAQIDYIINEGGQYKINDIIIYLNEEKIGVSIKDIEEELKLKKGKTFNISKLRTDFKLIKTKVSNKGYAYAKVTYDIRKNENKHSADIIFNVIEGDKVYINDIIIKNNNRTLDRVIRRDVYLAPNDLFNLTDFIDTKNKLNRSGFFSSVKLTKKRVSKNLMDIIVDVSEAPTGNLVIGGGYGSYDGWMLNTSISDKNIFGSGLKLDLKYDYSKRKQTATVGVSNPSIYDSIYDGSFKIYSETSSFDNDDNTTETTNSKGLSLGIGRSINRNTRIGIIYSLDEEDKINETNSTKSYYNYITSALTPYINFNNTDSYYVPRNGFKIGTSLKYANLGGDAHYLQSNSYFKYFFGLEDYIDYDAIIRYKTTIRVLEDLGDITGKTFYLGGPSSLRGYESYAFQPSDTETNPFKKRLTNTLELSLPLMPKAKMRWALFYDYSMIGEESFTDIKKSGYGVSLNWYSPVGPIQFIFSRALNPSDADKDKTSNFEFSLGNTF